MGTYEEAVRIVRAALEPNADPATKQQAAAMLRSLLAALEATPGQPLNVPAAGAAAAPGSAQAPSAAADPLGAFIDIIKRHVPPDKLQQLDQAPRLRIPLVPLPSPKT